VIRFYFGSGSPFAWRVQLVLEEKGLPYEPVLLSFAKGEHKSPEHLARNPRGKVPALTDGGLSLYESTAIVEYLEERYPEHPLLPADPGRRALVRIEELECVEYFFPKFQPVARQAFFTPPAERDAAVLDAARAEVRKEIDILEARAAKRGGSWIAGDGPTRADFTWLPFIELAARGGVDLEHERTPWLVDWRTRLRARPSYDKSYPPHWRQ
jgi:glutathione S-transferase